MNILIYKDSGGNPVNLSINPIVVASLVALCLLTLLGTASFISYKIGSNKSPVLYNVELAQQIDKQQQALNTIRQTASSEINAMASRIGQLQAHITRVDALGTRLLSITDIDGSEFNFTQPPALGGPEEALNVDNNNLDKLEASIMALENQIQSSELQLALMGQNMVDKTLKESVSPKGQPVKRGWVSSQYGWRVSPFGGTREFHKGVDIAAVEGSQILAVGGGVVTWSGPRYGYGNMVEVTHGDGYITRYAHNKSNTVKEGQAVKKGEQLGFVGSTGRSTGPHIHFEVIKDGKRIDPAKFLTKK